MRFYGQDTLRRYIQCLCCRLVFVPARYQLSFTKEKAYYDLHQNETHDIGYRTFLSRLFNPMQNCLTPPAKGLDFGCGSGPALAAMFHEAGYEMAIYDPYYAPDISVLKPYYDFITATEVVEHLFHPGQELGKLYALLKPGGWLGIMTKLVTNQTAFSTWHYKRDPTHVCFFSRDTFSWWATQQGCEVSFIDKDVILLHKPCSPS